MRPPPPEPTSLFYVFKHLIRNPEEFGVLRINSQTHSSHSVIASIILKDDTKIHSLANSIQGCTGVIEDNGGHRITISSHVSCVSSEYIFRCASSDNRVDTLRLSVESYPSLSRVDALFVSTSLIPDLDWIEL